MKYSSLGNTGLRVSQLALGILAMSPAQYSLSISEGRRMVDAAVSEGINFFDVAELYEGYQYLGHLNHRDDVVISSRSYAYDRETMRQSIDLARKSLGRDNLHIFGLHEQESIHTLRGHKEAIDYLQECKSKGIIKAISVSTHYVDCVLAASRMPEIDVIFAILNIDGLGIRGGRREDMERALMQAHLAGKGIYLMKALGGGHLQERAREALSYARDFPYKDSVCVGLKDEEELSFALAVMEGRNTPHSLSRPKHLMVESWCEGCGECERTCGFGAITVVNGKATIDGQKCLMCGYCARVCPHFCVKVMC